MTTLDPWLVTWCQQHLGATPVGLLLTASHMSDVTGVSLDDGRNAVIKSRHDPFRRAITCVEVQRHAAAAGFPAARPLTPVSYHDGRAVNAEEWRPGGDVLRGDTVAVATAFGQLYAELATLISGLPLPAPAPNPEWVNWDHPGPGLWPSPVTGETASAGGEPALAPAAPSTPDASVNTGGTAPSGGRPSRSVPVLPAELISLATRTRAILLTAAATLPPVLGHADWETQNLRWNGTTPHAVHDWDSIASHPEAALAGAASGAFASAETLTLPPVESSAAFLDAYTSTRRRALSLQETQAAWAASLWTALHNARAEIINGWPPNSLTAVLAQGEERLRLAESTRARIRFS